MSENRIIKLDKVESKLLQFVQSAIDKDGHREVLQCVHLNGEIVGCDGHRLHAIKETGNAWFDHLEGIAHIDKLRAGENYIEPIFEESIQDKYPDYKAVLPVTDNGVLIGINPQFLMDICKYADKDSILYILIRGSDKPIEIKGTCQDSDIYALVMPMHTGGIESWRQRWQPQGTKIIETEPEESSDSQEVVV